MALLLERFVDARPALGAFDVQALDGRSDLAMRGLGHAAEFFRGEDDGDVPTLSLHEDGFGLRHVDELAETVLGVGRGEGFHGRAD